MLTRCWKAWLCGSVMCLLPLGSLMADEGRGKEGDRKDAPVRREGEVKREGDQPRREGEIRREGDRPREGGEGRPMPPPPRREGEDRPPQREGEFRGPPGPPRDGMPHDMEHLRAHDPEMFQLMQQDHELERRSFDLSQRLRRGGEGGVPAADREKAILEVKELVQKQFAVRQDRRKLQVKRMEEELNKIKASIENREQQKAEIIERRVNELTGKPSDLDF